jgi:molybdopterin-guanine dinucleotide biosynthesis protein A
MKLRKDVYGLVVCGGKSTRMGSDKAFLVYHQKPQCYHLADILGKDDQPLCTRVVISCNENQINLISQDYDPLPDLSQYRNSGPIASLLTAFHAHPANDFLVIGCDYPFIEGKDLSEFLETIQEDSLVAAFYNSEHKYEPLLAWYSHKCAPLLKNFYKSGQNSLQHFLRENSAEKYRPENQLIMRSVDTPSEFSAALAALTK